VTQKRKGGVRQRSGSWYVWMHLRSGKWWERKIDRPTDGGAYNEEYANLHRAQLVYAYENGLWDPEAPSPEETAGPTVVEFVRQWADRQTYESAPKDVARVELYVAPSPLANVRVKDLRPKLIADYIEWLKKLPSRRGETLGASAVRNAFDVVQRAMDSAVVEELIPTNPCSLKPIRKGLPRKRDKDPAAREGWVFTREEIERLISDEAINPDRRVQYAILFLTGMRFGEFAALRWRDYDRTTTPLGRITVSRAIKSVSKTEGRTKTEAVKRVPVHPTLAAILAEWHLRGWPKAFGRAPESDDYVLPSVRGRCKGEPRNDSASNRSFKADQRKLGMRKRHQHVARHTFISLAQDDGADGSILKWVTHAPPDSAFDGYNRGQWLRLCHEVSKLRIERRGGAKVLEIREAK